MYFTEQSLFDCYQNLVSLETGEVADVSVNILQAELIGNNILNKMVGIPVFIYPFKRKSIYQFSYSENIQSSHTIKLYN